MSEVAINYKNSSIATMDASGTKTLLTSGKYCEDDIEVVYTRPGGGSANIQSLSVTQNGTYTASGGVDGYSPVSVNVSGGGGLVYETGTWTPSEDVAEAWIPFANTHTEAPFFYSIIATEYTDSDSSNGGTDYINYAQIIGEPFRIGTSTSSVRYGAARKLIRSGGSIQASIAYPHTNTGDSTTSYSRYWAKETGIRAAQYSSGYYWRAGITYKWAAIWAPTT